jgi:hypothetical protein
MQSTCIREIILSLRGRYQTFGIHRRRRGTDPDEEDDIP